MVPCTPQDQCRDDGLKIYSSTVVFGKNGQIEAKYEISNSILFAFIIKYPEGIANFI
jgi:hypothetical protein